MREDERLFNVKSWGKDYGKPRWPTLRAKFARALEAPDTVAIVIAAVAAAAAVVASAYYY